jgi:oxygen-independent coproporphyrinogen-3 oxidase
MKNKDRLLAALQKEMELRKTYLPDKSINSVYFGGGTPSVLTKKEIQQIFDTVHRYFSVAANAEITFEANPDDLTQSYLTDLRDIGINRLSIGIQSFNDKDLEWMNRRHNAREAENCVKLSQDCGFSNINIDLIYGLPTSFWKTWVSNLEKFISLQIPHLSAYHLTVEPKTVFGVWKRKGRMEEVFEDKSIGDYEQLIDVLAKEGYEHYEISNFCKEGFYSRHNLNYWKQGNYAGFGPSSHSYNGFSRQWNIAINESYIQKIENNQHYFETEFLGQSEKYNDYILTRMRTCWGISLPEIRSLFGEIYYLHLKKALEQYKGSDWIIQNRDEIRFSEKGMFVSDSIIEKLFYVV